jgi:hypothetical protein
MGLLNKVKNKQTNEDGSILQSETLPEKPCLNLTPKEIEFLISTLGDTDVKVKQIEFVYKLLVKMQEYYVQCTKKDTSN